MSSNSINNMIIEFIKSHISYILGSIIIGLISLVVYVIPVLIDVGAYKEKINTLEKELEKVNINEITTQINIEKKEILKEVENYFNEKNKNMIELQTKNVSKKIDIEKITKQINIEKEKTLQKIENYFKEKDRDIATLQKEIEIIKNEQENMLKQINFLSLKKVFNTSSNKNYFEVEQEKLDNNSMKIYLLKNDEGYFICKIITKNYIQNDLAEEYNSSIGCNIKLPKEFFGKELVIERGNNVSYENRISFERFRFQVKNHIKKLYKVKNEVIVAYLTLKFDKLDLMYLLLENQ